VGTVAIAISSGAITCVVCEVGSTYSIVRGSLTFGNYQCNLRPSNSEWAV
jgi:hypothetical protein